jgi:phosphatidate phosphatase PAH1
MLDTVCLMLRELQVSSLFLFPFNCLEQTLEVASAETIKVVSLDDFNENCWPVHQWLGEKLQQVSSFVKVDENIELLNRIKVFFDLNCALAKTLAHRRVVRVRYADKLYASSTHVCDGRDNVWCFESNVLNSWTIVKVYISITGQRKSYSTATYSSI